MVDPLQIPALKTPPGVTSQFPTTYSSEQAWFYVAATLSAVVPGTLLLLRLYTKIRIVRNVDLIDCSTPPFRILTEREYSLTDVCRSCHIIICELASGKPKSETVHRSFLTHFQKNTAFPYRANHCCAVGLRPRSWRTPMEFADAQLNHVTICISHLSFLSISGPWTHY